MRLLLDPEDVFQLDEEMLVSQDRLPQAMGEGGKNN